MYPRISRRIKAAAIDGAVIPISAVAVLVGLNAAGVESGTLKIAAAIFVVLLLEPIAVAMTGATVGHRLVGLRVRRMSSDQHINLLAATVRFIVKTLTGISAFLFVPVTRKRQALHDLAARSLIVHTATDSTPAYEMLDELTVEEEGLAYRNVWRRFGVIVVYLIAMYLAMSVALSLLLSGECLTRSDCSEHEVMISGCAAIAFVLALIAVVILGWMGRLYGARKPKPTLSLQDTIEP